MQVRTQGWAGVPDLGERRSGLDDIADLHGEAAGVQMEVEGKNIRGDFKDHVIATIVIIRLRYHLHVRGCIWLAVLDRNDRSIGDREHVLSKSIVLLVLSAVAVEDPAILDLVIVDGEEFGSFDADSVDGDTKVAVEVGLAAPCLLYTSDAADE